MFFFIDDSEQIGEKMKTFAIGGAYIYSHILTGL